ncbi:MAG: TlpA family protein disulfide reductase [Phycisphaerae bacterium]|nr:TlpA family protein disulfide reductase [Planctomycetia bacterium]MCK6466152.1 TlpA family protein disulfide reductase [Phycisphaerae bacterium]MCL4720171.1 TlpA family protein disulfide reductase [Phycisphaerae bacterium]NUQ09814.1 TlpA family protein disulfide reductase [Phycisphaerae bacterium]
MLALLLALVSGLPQTPTTTAPAEQTADLVPDVKALLARMSKAVEGIRFGEYDVQRYGVGKPLDERVPRLKGHVVFQPLTLDDPVGAKINIRGGYEDGSSNPFHLVYDGETFAIRFEKDDVVFKGKPAEDRSIIRREEIKLALEELFNVARMPYLLQPTTFEFEGRQTVGGVPCIVVMLFSESEESRLLPPDSLQRKVFRYRCFIAESDAIPRRIEYKLVKIPDITGEQAETGVVMEITNLRLNHDPPADAFAMPPEPKKDIATAPAPAPAVPAQPATPESAEQTEDQSGRKKRDRLSVGDPAPAWELEDLSGTKRSLAEFKGKVVLLDFWATWCKPCLMAAPDLEKIHAKYKDKAFVLLGVNVENDPAPAKRMLAEKATGYAHVLKAAELMRDYRVSSLPGFVIISPDGRIAHRQTGFGPGLADQLGRIIDAELAKTAAPKPASDAAGKTPTP